jgi:CHAD domain-containing protein
MAYVIALDEDPGQALARVISGQGAKLASEGTAADKDPAAFILKARVRCKRIRAALELAGPLIGEKLQRRENRWWRDTARLLSEARDATVQEEALETLWPVLLETADAASVRALSARIRLQRRLGGTRRLEAAAIGAFRERVAARHVWIMADARKAEPGLLAESVVGSYRAARTAMRTAFRDATPEAFHEWRKRAKAHGLQLRLVRLVFPLVSERVVAVRDLAQLLGAMQDIEVLLEALGAGVGDGIDARIGGALLAHRAKLEGVACEQGHDLFGEKPKVWRRRALDRQLSTPDL